MSAVASIAGFMKRQVLGQSLIRRNPLYYDRVRALLERTGSHDLAARRAWSEEQLRRTLRIARNTEYGRRVKGGDTLQSWPLLEKESLRGAQDAFTNGSRWLSAPAATGGTTGIPLKLVRSLHGVVFEQVCQDRLIELLGADPRNDRIAVLTLEAGPLIVRIEVGQHLVIAIDVAAVLERDEHERRVARGVLFFDPAHAIGRVRVWDVGHGVGGRADRVAVLAHVERAPQDCRTTSSCAISEIAERTRALVFCQSLPPSRLRLGVSPPV